MTDEEAIAHLTDMSNVNYKATDILIRRTKQVNEIKELLQSNVANTYFRSKVEEILSR